MTLNGAAHSRITDYAYLNVPVRFVLRHICVVFLALIPLAGPAISPIGYLGICCAIYGAMVLVGLEHRRAVKKFVDATTSVLGGRAPSNEKEERGMQLLQTLNLGNTLDLSRVLDVDFQDPELQKRGAMHKEMINQNPGVVESEGYESR